MNLICILAFQSSDINKIIYLPFCAWLVSHNIMCSIHVSCHVTEFSSFSIWVEYILSPFMCWWTCSWILFLMYSTWEYSYILNIMVSCSNIYLVLELINPMQVLCYVFRGNFILLSKLSDLIYISRDYCTYEHLLFCIFLIVAIPSGEKWYIIFVLFVSHH